MRQAAVVPFIALFIATTLYAQQDMGAITGVVTDGSGRECRRCSCHRSRHRHE